jgi:hypothetical protein
VKNRLIVRDLLSSLHFAKLSYMFVALQHNHAGQFEGGQTG